MRAAIALILLAISNPTSAATQLTLAEWNALPGRVVENFDAVPVQQIDGNYGEIEASGLFIASWRIDSIPGPSAQIVDVGGGDHVLAAYVQALHEEYSDVVEAVQGFRFKEQIIGISIHVYALPDGILLEEGIIGEEHQFSDNLNLLFDYPTWGTGIFGAIRGNYTGAHYSLARVEWIPASSVPEPHTALLLAIGLTALAFRSRAARARG